MSRRPDALSLDACAGFGLLLICRSVPLPFLAARSRVIEDGSIDNRATVIFANCKDCTFALESMCTKVFMQACVNVTLTINAKVVTNMLEVYKCEGVTCNINSKIATLQMDMSKEVTCNYESKDEFGCVTSVLECAPFRRSGSVEFSTHPLRVLTDRSLFPLCPQFYHLGWLSQVEGVNGGNVFGKPLPIWRLSVASIPPPFTHTQIGSCFHTPSTGCSTGCFPGCSPVLCRLLGPH